MLKIGKSKSSGALHEIQPSELVTHGCIVGMTGSGKTGLAIGLLEELALARVPIIAIDPKGDLCNMLLALDSPSEYVNFVDRGQAKRMGISIADLAMRTEIEWRRGREADGCTDEILREYREDLCFRIYAPGGGPGQQLSIVSALQVPGKHVDMAQHVTTVAMSLLAMARPRSKPGDVVLLSHCILQRWQRGEGVNMPMLIGDVLDPPFARMGAIDVETFYPRAKRHGLAMDLNAMVASPTWEAWCVGDDLDAGKMFITDGNPIVNIVNIAHLSEPERHFFVALLLNQLVSWMRSEHGTSELRAVLYMDEVAGYFPPNGMPAPKRPMLTLLKQARAFGLGCILSTQNPADIDYKMMSNMGMWLVGKLTMERDKKRLMDGLASSDNPMDPGEISEQIAGLGKREFLVHSMYRNLDVIKTRHTISWLKGPMTPAELEMIGGQSVQDTKAEVMLETIRQHEVAVREQQRTVSALEGDVTGEAMMNVLRTGVMAVFGGRFGRRTALRSAFKTPNRKKSQALLEARARLESMQAQLDRLRAAYHGDGAK